MLMFVMWLPIQVTNMRCTPTTVLSPVLCSPCLMLGLSWDPAFQSANRMESVKIGWIMDNHGRSWINEVPWSWDLSISFHYETWLRHNSTWCPTRCWGWDLPHSPYWGGSPGDHLRELCAGDAADDAGRLGSLCRLEHRNISFKR